MGLLGGGPLPSRSERRRFEDLPFRLTDDRPALPIGLLVASSKSTLPCGDCDCPGDRSLLLAPTQAAAALAPTHAAAAEGGPPPAPVEAPPTELLSALLAVSSSVTPPSSCEKEPARASFSGDGKPRASSTSNGARNPSCRAAA